MLYIGLFGFSQSEYTQFDSGIFTDANYYCSVHVFGDEEK